MARYSFRAVSGATCGFDRAIAIWITVDSRLHLVGQLFTLLRTDVSNQSVVTVTIGEPAGAAALPLETPVKKLGAAIEPRLVGVVFFDAHAPYHELLHLAAHIVWVTG